MEIFTLTAEVEGVDMVADDTLEMLDEAPMRLSIIGMYSGEPHLITFEVEQETYELAVRDAISDLMDALPQVRVKSVTPGEPPGGPAIL